MKVTVVAVGSVRGLLAEAVDDYQVRAGRYWRLVVREVAAGIPKSSGPEPAAVLKAEGERILRQIPEGAHVVALTRSGKSKDSEGLADFLEKMAVGSVQDVVFLIGGAFGLDPEVLKQADHRLSLSAATLPHEIARLVLLEQIYRAGTIRSGEPYHKGH
jgi:23S rRNA (pseudouridine1915-N3)-methyltransferase